MQDIDIDAERLVLCIFYQVYGNEYWYLGSASIRRDSLDGRAVIKESSLFPWHQHGLALGQWFFATLS